LKIVAPIASHCLGLIEGNHERKIKEKTEHDVYSAITMGIKEQAGWPEDYPLALGMNGWLRLEFKRKSGHGPDFPVAFIHIYLHHGFGGGRLAGGAALNAERLLWTHDCDLVLLGHTHRMGAQWSEVLGLDSHGNLVERKRGCAHCGSFLRSYAENADTYSEMGGYMPLPIGGCEIVLRPHIGNNENPAAQGRVRIVTQ
jgi:hypothetical protein